VEAQRERDALLAGLFLALASLDSWFFTIFLGMWTVLAIGYSLVANRKRWSWKVGRLLFLTAVTAGVLVAPFLIPVIADSVSGSVESALAYYADEKSTDLLAFVVPGSGHPLLSPYTRPVYERFEHWRPAFLGYSALALALYAVTVCRRRSLLWLLSGLIFAALAMGTRLHIYGVEYPAIPLPYRTLIDVLPVLKIIRQTNRFNVMVTLSLAVLVGLACADIIPRVVAPFSGPGQASSRLAGRVGGSVTALVSALVLFEYLAVPCPLSPSKVSPFYHALEKEGMDRAGEALSSDEIHATQAAEFAILELPIDDFHSRYYLYPQTLHHKKLVNGYVARAPTGAQAFIRSHPLIKALQIQMEVDPALHDVEKEIGLLAANDIRYVVIHKQALPPQPPVDEAVLASWRALFGPDPAYEDQEIVVYRTRLAPGYSRTPILQFSDQLGVMELRTRRTRLQGVHRVDQALTVDLTWKALNDLDRAYVCSLSLVGPKGEILTQMEAEVISPRFPTSRWSRGVVVADQYAISLDPSLPAGEYVLSIEVVGVPEGEELEAIDTPIRIDGDARPLVPALDDVQFPAYVNFGGEMRLLGYTPRQHGDRLAIDVYWQALRATHKEYKIFVHLLGPVEPTLLGPVEQAIVAQHDAMPRDWSYPTSLWARRQVFVDRIELDITGVAPGAYRLAIGVYEPEGERLPALGADGQPIPDRRAILDEAIKVDKP